MGPNVLRRGNINRRISIGELGGGDSRKELPGYMEMVSAGAETSKIQESMDLTTRQPIARKRGPADGIFLKLLVYGDHQMAETQN